jgi:hypothetical protein
MTNNTPIPTTDPRLNTIAKHIAACKAEFIGTLGFLPASVLASALENELTRLGVGGDSEITFWQNLTAVAHAGEVVNLRDEQLATKYARRVEQAAARKVNEVL